MANQDDWGKDDEVIKKPEPGWFEPGSKSEAAVRGFSQGATFGFGDEAQAGLRSIPELFQSGGLQKYLQSYRQLKNEEQGANQKSIAQNPGSYFAGNIVAALPQAMNVAAVAKGAAPILGSQALGSAARGVGTGGAYGVAQGVGNADTIADIPKSAAIQGAIGAVTGGVSGGIVGKGMTVTPAALKAAEDKLLSTVSSATRPLPGGYIEAAKEAGKNNLVAQLVTSGSGAGAGLYSGFKQDWSDPYSAMANTARDTGLGAMLGYGVTRGVAGSMAAKDALSQVAKETPAYFRASNTVTAKSMADSNFAAGAPFASLNAYLKDLPQDEKRKKAMELQSSPQGRALSNAESPIAEEQWGQNDEVIKEQTSPP